jgi:hypothetical protein
VFEACSTLSLPGENISDKEEEEYCKPKVGAALWFRRLMIDPALEQL